MLGSSIMMSFCVVSINANAKFRCNVAGQTSVLQITAKRDCIMCLAQETEAHKHLKQSTVKI